MRRPSEPTAEPARAACACMGTRFELVITAADAPRDRWDAVAADALALVEDWHRRLNRFDRASWVGVFNARPPRAPIGADDDLLDLLACCDEVRRASAGAFDPAGGRFAGVRFDRGAQAAWREDERAALDFGAVAKGHALDDAAGLLRDAGVTGALLHGGTSSVLAIGAPPGASAWVVAIGPEPGAPRVALRDAALGVSRNDDLAPRPGHVIDARGGPSALPIAAVIATGPRAGALADAWSTALLILGERPAEVPASLTTLLRCADAWRVQGPASASVRRHHPPAHPIAHPAAPAPIEETR